MCNRVHFSKMSCCRYFLCVITALLLFLPARRADAQTQRPNIILILGDDIGYKTLTCNGGTSYATPNLDTLAQQGMRFTQCHASPLCSPSRFMLLTGKYNFRNYTKWGSMDPGQKTIGNMMKDAGYSTACFGKWQLDGGDASVHAFGFDNYCLFDAFLSEKSKSNFRYKSPKIYTHGAYLADSETANKYGEDIFTDSLLSFIDSNKSAPFFIYYPMVLAHSPFAPTPDDSAFAAWDPAAPSDTAYYPSMIEYMDKKIGQIVEKVKSLGIENNTLIIYVGDNGTPGQVAGDDSTAAGKSSTTEFGTHVPLLVYGPGNVTAGAVNNDLIDFTDFLPTIAGIADISVPSTYGPLDGVSFSPRLTDQAGTPRDWIFYHYDPFPGTDTLKRWAQTATYKLYDTSSSDTQRLFYNIINDENEISPIPDTSLASEEAVIKQQLLDVINAYIVQGIPILSKPTPLAITDSSITISGTIEINGGSTVSESGVVWSTSPNPTILTDNHTLNNAEIGPFQDYVSGLTSNTTYYVRAYATNIAGTGYGDEISFKTHLHAPNATLATGIDSNSFIAHWDAVTGAESYRIDVSSFSIFSTIKAASIKEGFNNGINPPGGWYISKGIAANSTKFGAAAPSLQFKASGQQVITKVLVGPATRLSFWIKGSVANAGALLVEGFDGNGWTIIDSITNLPFNSGVVKVYNTTSIPPLGGNLVQFRFTYTKTNGNLFFDDVSIKYNKTIPSFVTGYNNLTINDTSQQVTGLTHNTNYYYRVRAVDSSGTSGNSNVITTATCSAPIITSITGTNLTCNGNNTGAVGLTVTGIEPLSYNWRGPNGFTSSNQGISSLTAGTYELTLTSNGGCAVDTSIIIMEPSALTASVDANTIRCNGDTAILNVTASGATGNYHYSLSDGITTTGPQDDNHFTVLAGNYTATVTDDAGCSVTTDTLHVTEPQVLNVIATAEPVTCNGGTTIVTVTATGGTGNYHYSLSDGINTTGPQDDNHFTVSAGNYTAIVADDNHCPGTRSVDVKDGHGNCRALASVESKLKPNGTELNVHVFPNPASTKFILTIESNSNENVEIIIMNSYGKKVYQATGRTNDKYMFGNEFNSGIYFIKVMQGKNIQTVKILKGT